MMERNNMLDNPDDAGELPLDFQGFDEGNVYVLPPDFVPGRWDVICQRGKECFEHAGNRRFRMAIENHLDNYMKVKSRQHKSMIVTTIVEGIKKSAGEDGGGFVRKDLLTRRWFRVSDKLAREKVGQALRDAIKTRRASNKKTSSNSKVDTQASRKPESRSNQANEQNQQQQQYFAKLNAMQYMESQSGGSNNIFRQQDTTTQQAPSSATFSSGPLNPSSADGTPLVPFMESKNFAASELEPRPISLPAKLSDFLADNNDTTTESGGGGNQNNAALLMMSRLHDLEGLPGSATNSSLSNIVQNLGSTNLQSIFPVAPSSTYQSSAYQQAFANNINAAHSAYGGNTYPFPTIDQQQILPTVIAGRRMSLGGLDDTGTTDLSGVFNPFDVANAATLFLQKQQSQREDQEGDSSQQQQQHKHNTERYDV